MLERVGRNVFSLGLSRILSGIILFVVYLRLVVYLGPGEFGKFSLVFAYYLIFVLLIDLGISRFVIKKVSEDRSRAGLYLANFLLAQTIIAFFVLAVFFALPRLLGYEADVTRAMTLAGAGLFLAALSIPFAAIAQAWQRIRLVAVVNFINSLIHAGWALVVIYFSKDFVFLMWFLTFVGVLDFALYAWFTRDLAKPVWSPQRQLVGTMLLLGLPFAFISGFEMVVSKIDVIIQKIFLPFSEVGLYSAAYRFLDFLTFIPAMVAIGLFPFLSERADWKNEEVRANLDVFNRYMTMVAVPLGVGATLLADKIILSLFDERYLGAVLPLQILIWATVVTFIYAVPNVMMIVRQTRKAVFVLAAAVVLNALGNYLLVPHYGILASAWLTVISYAVVGGAYFLYTRELADYSVFRYLFWPALASAVMGAVLWPLQGFSIFVLVPAAILVYFGALILAGYLRSDDWRYFRSVTGLS